MNWQPAQSSAETEQARRVLSWLETALPRELINTREYSAARQATGSPAQTNRGRPYHGMPLMPGPRMPVSGTGDDAHGHTRLRRVITQVVVPAIKDGRITPQLATQIRERTRGDFPDCYHQIDDALASARRQQENAPAEDRKQSVSALRESSNECK